MSSREGILALFNAQFSTVYILASALLLRSKVPPQMSSIITNALGAPLDTSLWGRKEDFFVVKLEGLEASMFKA
ncbi:hypothetical protein RUND412_010019 [Rhizina undulata]